MKGELERTERGRDCGIGIVQMGKGEDGMDVASSFEDDDDEEGEGEDEEMPSKSKCAPLTLTDEQAALVAPQSNQLLHRHLGKRYYAEALDFMRMVEGAMCAFLSSFLFFFLLSPSLSLLSCGEKSC